MIGITEHAKNRIKERCGEKGGSIIAIANSAYLKGKKIEDCEKRMRKYLERILKHSHGNQVRLWSNTIFIFRNNTLITVYPVSNKILSTNGRKRRFYEESV